MTEVYVFAPLFVAMVLCSLCYREWINERERSLDCASRVRLLESLFESIDRVEFTRDVFTEEKPDGYSTGDEFILSLSVVTRERDAFDEWHKSIWAGMDAARCRQ